MEQTDDRWTRICPQCNEVVAHKNRAKCHGAERLNKPCVKCSRSNNGKSNSKTDECPVCGERIRIPVYFNAPQDDLITHAAMHGLKPHELWLVKEGLSSPPTCKCTCGAVTEWRGWWNGYNTWLDGHSAFIHSGGYTPEEEARLTASRGSNWRGERHPGRGRTKENDPRVVARVERARQTRIKGIANGTITFEYSRFTKEEIELKLAKNTCLAFDRLEDYTSSHVANVWVTCRFCDWHEKVKLAFAANDKCPRCRPNGSAGQHSIADFIEGLGFKAGRNVRGVIGKHELDVFVPQKLLAVEFNGLYWHCEAAGRDRFYHQDKADKCSALGIKLLQVFEDEWSSRPNVIKDAIKRQLGCGATLDSSVCTPKRLSNTDCCEFFNRSTTDASVVPGALTFALDRNGDVVSAIVASRNNDTVNVHAWADALGLTVDGSLDALVEHACRSLGCTRACAKIDPRLGTGRLFAVAGWILAHTGDEMRWYTDGHVRVTDPDEISDQERVSPIWGLRELTYVKRFSHLPAAHP